MRLYVYLVTGETVAIVGQETGGNVVMYANGNTDRLTDCEVKKSYVPLGMPNPHNLGTFDRVLVRKPHSPFIPAVLSHWDSSVDKYIVLAPSDMPCAYPKEDCIPYDENLLFKRGGYES